MNKIINDEEKLNLIGSALSNLLPNNEIILK